MTGVRPRVLIVDDEPKLVRLAREVLQATGFDVLTAATGQEAIEAVALEQPDLVLLDNMLPAGMDGYDVAERIRQFSGVPIIMLTAKDRQVDLLRGFDVGADDYITKPFEARELLARIGRARRSDRRQRSTNRIICGELHIVSCSCA